VTDRTLSRAEAILTDLTELIETARAVPMSGSCVVPRERTLDLLDALRAALPPELVEARRIVADSDRLLAEAHEAAAAQAQRSRRDAEEELRRSRAAADDLLIDARAAAAATRESSEAEHLALVSADAVHRAAVSEAAGIVAAAQERAAQTRQRAEDYAESLTADADRYADRVLSQLSGQLRRLADAAVEDRRGLGTGQAIAGD
jgi:cell division septum initiation protein DivIVA